MKRCWLLMCLLLAVASAARTSSALAKRPDGEEQHTKSAAARHASEGAERANGSAGRGAPAPRSAAKPAAKTSAKVAAKATKPGAKANAKPAANAAGRGAARSSGKLAAKGKAKGPCYARPVQLVRVRGQLLEPYELSLTHCNGAPNRAVLDTLSILARPRDVDRPKPSEIRKYRALPVASAKVAKARRKAKKLRDPAFVTEHVRRLDPGLLVRLQKIAKRYPGRRIEVISGYRPDARDTSRHHHGRALDLRVEGVSRERLRNFLRTFDDTGVGYYPNSYFVHMDVRETKGYWVDWSGPGEPADYSPIPTKKRDIERARDTVLKGALADLAELRKPAVRADRRTASATSPR